MTSELSIKNKLNDPRDPIFEVSIYSKTIVINMCSNKIDCCICERRLCIPELTITDPVVRPEGILIKQL
jgi:hypothetical protein